MSIIYKPKGAAGEYAVYAVNFFNGCSNGCAYCYNKRGVASKVCGAPMPVMKKGYKDEKELWAAFCNELFNHIDDIRKHELFLSFTTDPFLEECIELTKMVLFAAYQFKFHVYVLSKIAYPYNLDSFLINKYIHIGMTLTGCDWMEEYAPANETRIDFLRYLHNKEIDTFASIEPIIDFNCSLKMIHWAAPYTNEFRIGLMSPYKKGRYTKEGMNDFVHRVLLLQRIYGFEIMWKSSFQKLAKEYGIELTENVNLYGREEIDRTEIYGRGSAGDAV